MSLRQQNKLVGKSTSATIHLYRGPYEYPVIVLDDITWVDSCQVLKSVSQDTT